MYVYPWLKWLKKHGEHSSLLITSQLLLEHLEQRFRGKQPSSFNQTGNAIRRFMNIHLSKKIRVLGTMENKINTDNINMPQASMRAIGRLLEDKIAEIRGRNSTLSNRQQLSKCLGECLSTFSSSSHMLCLCSYLSPAPLRMQARRGGVCHPA